MNLKFIDAKQAKDLYNYKNIKRKLYRTNAAIWYNKNCRHKHLVLIRPRWKEVAVPAS